MFRTSTVPSSGSAEDDSTTTSTTTSNSSSNDEGSDEDDDDEEFVDAPEASGTLISQFLAQRLADREDLTQVSNWGGSPSNEALVDQSGKNSVGVDSNKTCGSGDLGGGASSSASHSRVTTLRSISERARHSKLEETRRRLDLEEDYNSDDDKLLGVTSHSSSPSSSCDAISINKYQQPFKVIEQDNLSSRGAVVSGVGVVQSQSQQHQLDRQKSTKSTASVTESKPPDIVSSCQEIPDQVAATTPEPPPVPPPRRKKKAQQGASRSSPTPSSVTSKSSNLGDKPNSGTSSNANLYVSPQGQDEEKEKIKIRIGSGPKVLRRTESLGLVGKSAPLEKKDPNASKTNSAPPAAAAAAVATAAAISAAVKVRQGPSSKSNTEGRIPKSNMRRLDSPIPGSFSLPGPINVPPEVKKHSLPILRTKTDSGNFGKALSDLEILEKVTVLNLDTGERIPLSSAEHKIPKCINPLSLHIMRLTSEYVSEDPKRDSSDDNSSRMSTTTTSEGIKTKKRLQLKKFIGSVGRRAVNKAKAIKANVGIGRSQEIEEEQTLSLPEEPPPSYQQMHRASFSSEYADQTSQHSQQMQLPTPPTPTLQINNINFPHESSVPSHNNPEPAGPTILKMKASTKHKGPYDFENLELAQELNNTNTGPIWCMKFSLCGRLLAAAGQDRLIKVYVLKSQMTYFIDLIKTSKVSPTPSLESMNEQADHHGKSGTSECSTNSWPFVALSSYSGHTADLLDIAWSKSFFLLSSSMDRTVRLWHISRKECLCTFQHVDFVTAIAFHPRDDRYFLSGSLDSKVRIWNIPDKKVALWNEVPGPHNLITTANFCQNGKFAVVGTYDGRVIFYHTEQLKYHTQIILNKKKSVKISGIEPMPGEDKILVTSNDSRVRLYDLRDLSMICKYTGSVTRSSQIKASFSHDGKFLISGSENNFIYLWRTAHEYVGFGSARRDRNKYWEGVRCHDAVVTCAIFSPDPDLILKDCVQESNNYSQLGYVVASADFNGQIKVFVCKIKAKCSSLPVSAIAERV